MTPEESAEIADPVTLTRLSRQEFTRLRLDVDDLIYHADNAVTPDELETLATLLMRDVYEDDPEPRWIQLMSAELIRRARTHRARPH